MKEIVTVFLRIIIFSLKITNPKYNDLYDFIDISLDCLNSNNVSIIEIFKYRYLLVNSAMTLSARISLILSAR